MKGEIFANVWQTDLHRADRVRARERWLDVVGSSRPARPVLNGIAERAGDRLFITGKLWP